MERNRRENVISWMVRDGSFAQRYVFVPICQANHWSLLLLCNFVKDFNNTARPCILLLDSLETREENIEPDVRKFVFSMYKKWKPKSSSQHIHNIPFRKPKMTRDWFTQSEFDSFCENLSYVWQDVAYEDIQTAVDTEENAMKEDIAKKKGDDINKQTALVLYTP
ncbi:Peptidase C48, SUMO/Sentrin/Ubl1 [Heracleum sosnowskyi]|uniref:Peptidase C48, SUMO/Sentrin/Ubl1 n=1 Tax=Heracleum sosnowskyi TaxID=360622 RepID=A0AAD8IKJ8_9APIA|nr:Peptidase C48, SUMO/Sentrin/Ubl1 [Heracleum sosnowskyi]